MRKILPNPMSLSPSASIGSKRIRWRRIVDVFHIGVVRRRVVT